MRATLVKLPRQRRRRRWARAASYLFSGFILAVLLELASLAWSDLRRESVSGDHVTVTIGCIPSNQEAQQCALRIVSEELHKHPHAKQVTIYWRDVWVFPDEIDQWALDYDRRDQYVYYGDGGSLTWGPVTEKMIDTVAAQGGVLSGLEKYGAQAGP